MTLKTAQAFAAATSSDRRADVHGMAIKPLDVPGPKLTEGHNGETAVDFVLADFETFFTGDLDEYAAFTDGSGRSLFPSFAVDVAVASCSGTSSRGLLLSFVRKGSSNPVVILTTPNSRHHRFEPNGSRPIFQTAIYATGNAQNMNLPCPVRPSATITPSCRSPMRSSTTAGPSSSGAKRCEAGDKIDNGTHRPAKPAAISIQPPMFWRPFCFVKS